MFNLVVICQDYQHARYSVKDSTFNLLFTLREAAVVKCLLFLPHLFGPNPVVKDICVSQIIESILKA